MQNHADIQIIAAYAPPNSTTTEADWETLFANQTPTILGGDLNAKHPSWNSQTTNTKGKTLHSVITRSSIVAHGPTEPTHFGTGRPDVLDIFLTQNLSLPSQIYTLTELSSDHNPVNFMIGEGTTTSQKQTIRTNWTRFTDLLKLSPIIARPTTKLEIELSTQQITYTIQSAIKQASTTSTKPIFTTLPPTLKDLIKQKNKAMKVYQRTLAPADRTIKNHLIEKVKNALETHRNEQWEQKLQHLNNDPTNIWKISKALKSAHIKIPPLHSTQGLVYTPEAKANALAESIEKQCSLNHHLRDLDFEDHVNRAVRTAMKPNNNPPIRPTSPHEIREMIKHLNKRKAPGPDEIPNAAIKHLPHRALMSLTNIFNSCLQLSYFPTRWKNADIIVLPKPGKNPIFPQNHRPISLLSNLGKLLEKLILIRLQNELRKSEIIPPEQFGFTAKHSTTHQIHRIFEHATLGFIHKQYTGLVLLDISKAFDKVWHSGLLYKMLQHNMNLNLIKLIASFLQNRTFQVKLETVKSNIHSLEAGVPQGSKLSPTLYNLYTSDLPKPLEANLALFADDTAIFTTSKSLSIIERKLQQSLDSLEEYFTRWLIEINPEKTQGIILAKRPIHDAPKLTFNNQEIAWSKTVTYLGVHLDEKLTFRTHIQQACTKARRIFKMQYPLFTGKNQLNLRNKRLLYSTTIAPILTYAAPAWGHAAKSHLSRLQITQNKCLRTTVAAPWFVRNNQIHRDLNIRTIHEQIQDIAEKYFATAKIHQNQLISSKLTYDPQLLFKYKRPMNMLN